MEDVRDARAKEILAELITKHPDMRDLLWEYTSLCLKVGGAMGVAACAEILKGESNVRK